MKLTSSLEILSVNIDIEEIIFVDDFRRKQYSYDGRIHHSYFFYTVSHTYIVILGQFKTLAEYERVYGAFPRGYQFPEAGLAEVFFEEYFDDESLDDFRHVKLNGLASSTVLSNVAIILYKHIDDFNLGAVVFQAANSDKANKGRNISLEETYDYLLGLTVEPRYNKRTGLRKKTPRSLVKQGFNVIKQYSEGGACYVLLQNS